MTFKRNNCRWLPVLEIDRRHELGSMIFSVISRMTSGILGIALFAAASVSAFAQDDDAFHYNRLLGLVRTPKPTIPLGCEHLQ